MVRVKDGKIAEAWNHYDFLNLNQQLGQTLAPQEAV
jgi:predicted ester cyclase